MSYLESSKVKVYPSAYRDGSFDFQSQLNTEENLTQVKYLSYLKDNNCFSYLNNDILIVYLGGYCFKLDANSLIALADGNNLYAHIHLRKIELEVQSNKFLWVLVNWALGDQASVADIELDNNSDEFQGIYFDTTFDPTRDYLDDSNNIYYSIQVCQEGSIASSPSIIVTQPLKLSSNEIRHGSTSNSIEQSFDTEDLSINTLNCYGDSAITLKSTIIPDANISLGNASIDSSRKEFKEICTELLSINNLKGKYLSNGTSRCELNIIGDSINNNLVDTYIIPENNKVYLGKSTNNFKEGYITTLNSNNINIGNNISLVGTSGTINASIISATTSLSVPSITSLGSIIVGNNISLTGSSGTITAQTFTATSDVRLKENIKEFIPKKSILDLSIKEFDFKDSKQHTIGCIAQDLKEICPEIVHENEKGYLSIEENKLIYLLLDEVKKLKKEVEELKK